MTSSESREQRRAERWNLYCFLRIVEPGNADELLGHLVDVSESGLRIMSMQPYSPGTECRFEVQIPQPSGCLKSIRLHTCCVWSRYDEGFGKYFSGFRFVNTDDATTTRIRDLIENMGAHQ